RQMRRVQPPQGLRRAGERAAVVDPFDVCRNVHRIVSGWLLPRPSLPSPDLASDRRDDTAWLCEHEVFGARAPPGHNSQGIGERDIQGMDPLSIENVDSAGKRSGYRRDEHRIPSVVELLDDERR